MTHEKNCAKVKMTMKIKIKEKEIIKTLEEKNNV